MVTDSNGLSTTVWYKSSSAVSTTESGGTNVTVYPYAPPTLVTETFRCNSSGTASDTGTYARVKLTYTISSCNSKNSASVHKVTVNSTDTTLTSGTAATIGAGALNVNSSYNAVYTVTDAFTTVTNTDIIPPQTIHRAYHPSGGVAFGTSAVAGKLRTSYDIALVKGSYTNTITSATLGANRTITLPNASGTVSLDGHTHVVALNNGQLTSTYKFFIIEYQDQYASGIKSTCVMPNNGVAVSFSYITHIAAYSAHYFVTFQASISSNTLTFSNATGTWIVSGDVGAYESATSPTIISIWGVK